MYIDWGFGSVCILVQCDLQSAESTSDVMGLAVVAGVTKNFVLVNQDWYRGGGTRLSMRRWSHGSGT